MLSVGSTDCRVRGGAFNGLAKRVRSTHGFDYRAEFLYGDPVYPSHDLQRIFALSSPEKWAMSCVHGLLTQQISLRSQHLTEEFRRPGG
ncbi:MAG: hypothetical protein ACR2NZ_08470 [Rubripirellula sp.]